MRSPLMSSLSVMRYSWMSATLAILIRNDDGSGTVRTGPLHSTEAMYYAGLGVRYTRWV